MANTLHMHLNDASQLPDIIKQRGLPEQWLVCAHPMGEAIPKKKGGYEEQTFEVFACLHGYFHIQTHASESVFNRLTKDLKAMNIDTFDGTLFP